MKNKATSTFEEGLNISAGFDHDVRDAFVFEGETGDTCVGIPHGSIGRFLALCAALIRRRKRICFLVYCLPHWQYVACAVPE